MIILFFKENIIHIQLYEQTFDGPYFAKKKIWFLEIVK